jgi:ABC-type branched-subunit amino acid transport system substrate-binding protein
MSLGMRWALFLVLLCCLSCAEKEVRRGKRIVTHTEAAKIDLLAIQKQYKDQLTDPEYIEVLRQFIAEYEGTTSSLEAERLLAELSITEADSAAVSTRKHLIGCILPLSGKYSKFGQRSLRGIQLAFSFFSDEEVLPYELEIYDSRGIPEEAERGVEKLLKEDQAIAILGPLLTSSSEGAARRAEQLKIPMINLSQHPTITTMGEYVFRYAMTREHEVNTLVKYACGDRGMKKFAILYPDDNYGIEFANLFWDKVEECGGMVEGIETYLPAQNDFNREIKRLVGLDQPKARRDEYKIFEEKAKIELNKEEIKESDVKLPPQIDFEALFIPDYAKVIGQIAPTLAYYDVENAALLGTEGWNSKELVERGGEYVEGAVFVDGFFRGGVSSETTAFVKLFEKTFYETPAIWEAQAYDAARLLLTVLSENDIETRESLKEKLSGLSGYVGATKEASFLSNRDVDKELFLLTVRKGEIREIE